MAAITGVLLTQRRLPNPKHVAAVAAKIADCARHEAITRGIS